MKLKASPYSLDLRRARTLQIVLFGAFVYCYIAVLQGERLLFFIKKANLCSPEQWLCLAPWHLGLPATLLAMTALFFWRKNHHMPRRMNGGRRLLFFLVLAFSLCLATSPDEAGTLELKMARYNQKGHYEKALKVSRNFTHPTTGILQQRITALTATGELNEKFFTYPYPPNGQTLHLKSANPIFQALLDRNLARAATLLSHSPHEQLQRAEEEALVLYNRLHTHPLFIYKNSTVEANYRDFLDRQLSYQRRHSGTTDNLRHPSVEERNMMADSYGDTYWYYYFYGNNR